MAAIDSSPRTRLYISPLNPALLSTVIPPSVQPLIANISYKSIPTFPENDYAYLELPVQEAQRIRRKLNGVTFKGMKLKVEEARADKKRKREEAERATQNAEAEKEVGSPKRAKKERRKKEEGVFSGVELPEGRDVKRGWTQPSEKDKKRATKSKKEKKDLDHKNQEMLFKTHLPPNIASKTSDKAEKKSKRKERPGKGKPGRDVEVKEFDKTTKYPTFLRSSTQGQGAKKAVEFVDGKGWVDEDGNVVEDVVNTRSTRPKPARLSEETLPEQIGTNQVALTKVKNGVPEDIVEDGISDSEDDEVELTEAPISIVQRIAEIPPKDEDKATTDAATSEEDSDSDVESSEGDTTSSDSSDDDSDSSHAEEESDDVDAKANDNINTTNKDIPPAIPSTSTDIIPQPNPPTIAPTIETTAAAPPKQIHPLEALYKRPAPKNTTTTTTAIPSVPTPSRPAPAPIQTAFSFFDNPSDNEDPHDTDVHDVTNAEMDDSTVQELMPPQTPFTQRDMEWRGLRSAAPTPDTAAFTRRIRPWDGGGDSDEEEEEGQDVQGDARRADEDGKVFDDDDEDHDPEVSGTNLHKNTQLNSISAPVQPLPASTLSAPSALSLAVEQQPETEFEKHFWAMRGEYNRSWKARKREARKEARQSENRRSGFGR